MTAPSHAATAPEQIQQLEERGFEWAPKQGPQRG
ncbi:hypothetical protein M2280_005526 [Prescottella agglutinans]|uniref:Uncharacterized protein n=1 Tax=Prescottella agglutinans TaxID=1644129 RepID=A0ABT6MIX1_9NOCA|nr:hypothetical protein [Prescottella agglutinans]